MVNKTVNRHLERSEPVQDIIERMPSRFGYFVTAIVLTLILLLLFFGEIIQYPDRETGAIRINAKYSPVTLVSNSSGKITLVKLKTKGVVKDGDYIAVIQNPANTQDVLKLKEVLSFFKINDADNFMAYPSFPTKISLGEVSSKYYTFLNALQKIYYHNHANLFQKQEEGFKEQISELKIMQLNNRGLKDTKRKNMNVYRKMLVRDSVLYSQHAATELEMDNSRAAYLSSQENLQTLNNDINNAEQRIEDYENKLQQLHVQKNDLENQMKLDVISSYDDLKSAIQTWELHFVFKAPMNGTVEFLKFWSNNEFIQAGEEAFKVIPRENKIIGQVHLPSKGAGKVRVGQEVIIKLDNYPFQEYGSIKGKVSSISSITNVIKINNQNDEDAYLVEVSLPKSMTTNYGSKLDFKFEIKGTADIITNDRRLIERFFDNLRYAVKK